MASQAAVEYVCKVENSAKPNSHTGPPALLSLRLSSSFQLVAAASAPELSSVFADPSR